MSNGLRSILITGAAGLLGSHLADTMLNRGWRVTGVDNLSLGLIDHLANAMKQDRFTFYQYDVCDRTSFDHIQHHDVIVHMAAYKIEVPGLQGTDILAVNTHGTESMLQLASEWGSRFVFASTSDVYGKNPMLPFSEEADLVLGPSNVARWGYASSKIFDEHLCFAYQRRYGLNVTILRYFNTYGPRHELSPRSGGPQALFLDAILKGRDLVVHGNGLQKRCFAYVDDSIEMTARAVESDSAIGEILNIGNPYSEITIRDLAQLALDVTGKNEHISIRFMSHEDVYQTTKYEEVNRRIPNISKAERLFGFSPSIDNREGLKRTYAWQSQLPYYQER